MASITQNKKDGKVISYKFRACVGRDEFGKQIFRCSTWKIPDGLIPSRLEKAAQKAAAEWERQVKEEYENDAIAKAQKHAPVRKADVKSLKR